MIKVTANGSLFIDLGWFYVYSGFSQFQAFLTIFKVVFMVECWPYSETDFRLEFRVYRRTDND